MKSDRSLCLQCGASGATFHIAIILDGESATADLCETCARAFTPDGAEGPDVHRVLDLIHRKPSGK